MPATAPIAADTLYMGYTPNGDRKNYFKVPIPAAGTQVTVHLSHLHVDDDQLEVTVAAGRLSVTRASAKDLLEKSGFRVRAVEATAMPYELALPALARSAAVRVPVRGIARLTARAWPTMFGYQFVFEAQKT